MTESNKPESNANETKPLMQGEEVKQQPLDVNSRGSSADSTTAFSSTIQSSMNQMIAFLQDAQVKTQIRTQLPAKFYQFPLSRKLEKWILKAFNLLFREQRVINLDLVMTMKEAIAINNQLLEQVSTLNGQVTTLNGQVTTLNGQVTTLNGQVTTLNEDCKKLDYVHINKTLPTFLELEEERDYIAEATSLLEDPIQIREKNDNKFLFYSLFENIFYNSVVVKEKQKIYLKYIDKLLNKEYPFLDVGCGRGEFLQNLKDRELNAVGVDLNEIEVSALERNGFSASCMDALDYLNSSDILFSGISAFQVVEHFSFDYLNRFLPVTFQKLANGGVTILETVNPHSLYALSNFYQDPTHVRPIPPEMLVFLMQWHGYKRVRVVYSSPGLEESRIFSQTRMNYYDYAVIGYKLSLDSGF